ncbi:hypothetical protein GCM10023321_70430 [Pseudonocardia eucalypti]|uniref:Uncharacterized protein n=1 Tax=Pseudonocardia eucalypti TaxID=648755 RepID=A0ABP9R682_9PSEU
MAGGFYRRMALKPAIDAAFALHTTVRHLRDAQPLLPSSWAGYLHAGP